MIGSVLYLVLAILALGFLIFIHELGHYFMARKVGMKVEVFSIGFGKPLVKWMVGDVQWQICVLPFGGYVKIAGMEEENGVEPHEIPDGFFGSSPWSRIKTSFMGPFANWVFAFLIFVLIWGTSGREKQFSEFTQRIGWIEKDSELYEKGIRPGDRITTYNGHEIKGFSDILNFSVIKAAEADVEGFHVNYASGEETVFKHKVKTYPHPSLVKGFSTVGITGTVNHLIYDKYSKKIENPLPEGSPTVGSGLQYGDRIVWADGEAIFSNKQLNELLNDGKVLLTIERDGKKFLKRVSRVRIVDLKLNDNQKEELKDWQYESGFQRVKKNEMAKMFILPYDLTNKCQVEKKFQFVSQEPKFDFSLQKGDKILAVDGTPVFESSKLFLMIQKRKINVIVERGVKFDLQSWSGVDQNFNSSVNWNDLDKMASSIGSDNSIASAGNLHLLKPIEPKRREEVYPISKELKSLLNTKIEKQKKAIEKIKDPKEKAAAVEFLKNNQNFQNQLVLGIPLQDRKVIYNPSPIALFKNAFVDTKRTLFALVKGNLNPKWLSGPIGIVQGIQHFGLTSGVKEFLYWVAVISFNLGFLNLLPLPPLDGGYILLSVVETVTRRPIKAKTMQKLVVPFAVLLIGLIIFATFNDVTRIITSLFS